MALFAQLLLLQKFPKELRSVACASVQWVPISIVRTHDFLQGLILGVLFSIPLILAQELHGHTLWAGVRTLVHADPKLATIACAARLAMPCSSISCRACCIRTSSSTRPSPASVPVAGAGVERLSCSWRPG